MVPIYVEHWGFSPNFALFSTSGECSLTTTFCHVSNASEEQKKCPKIIQRSDVYYSQIIGGMQSNYLGGYIPHPHRILAPLAGGLRDSNLRSVKSNIVLTTACHRSDISLKRASCFVLRRNNEMGPFKLAPRFSLVQ